MNSGNSEATMNQQSTKPAPAWRRNAGRIAALGLAAGVLTTAGMSPSASAARPSPKRVVRTDAAASGSMIYIYSFSSQHYAEKGANYNVCLDDNTMYVFFEYQDSTCGSKLSIPGRVWGWASTTDVGSTANEEVCEYRSGATMTMQLKAVNWRPAVSDSAGGGCGLGTADLRNVTTMRVTWGLDSYDLDLL